MSDSTTTAHVEQINPAEAIVGPNVRLDARLDKGFLASIKELGVLEPVIGYRDQDGAFVVLRGQRRTLAAVEVGRESIPVIVGASQEDGDRIIEQMAENDHREGMTTRERVAGLATLAGLGMTAAQIAKKTSTKRSTVDAALVVAGSEVATEAATALPDFTLEQAAMLVEFEDDEDATSALIEAAAYGQFEHTVQRLRDDRERESLRREAAEQLTAKGVRVVNEPRFDDHAVRSLDKIAPKGKERAYNKGTHTKCPGHAAYIVVRTRWVTGDDKKQHRTLEATPVYVCTQWQQREHADLRPSYSSSATTRPKAADMTQAEREAAKAARRDVIDSNKAWESAEPVRREFLATFATRKTAPKGSGPFLAEVLTAHALHVGNVAGAQLASEWFGVQHSGYGSQVEVAQAVQTATESRALHIAVCRILADLEANTSRDSWRHLDQATAVYLAFLAANGYPLSDVEKRAAGLNDPEPEPNSHDDKEDPAA